MRRRIDRSCSFVAPVCLAAAACSSGGASEAPSADAGRDARHDAAAPARHDATADATHAAARDAARDATGDAADGYAIVDDGSVAATRPPSAAVSPLFIGSGGFGYGVGSAFPGAAAPQGMAKVGPETSGPYGTTAFLHCSGYWYGDNTILGFSHLHLHGTGAQDYGVLGVMPIPAWTGTQDERDGLLLDVREGQRVCDARQVRGHAHTRKHPRGAHGDPARRASPLHLSERLCRRSRRHRPRPPSERDRHDRERDARRREQLHHRELPQPRGDVERLRRLHGVLRRQDERPLVERSRVERGERAGAGHHGAGHRGRRRPRLRLHGRAGRGDARRGRRRTAARRAAGRSLARLAGRRPGEPRRRDAELRIRRRGGRHGRRVGQHGRVGGVLRRDGDGPEPARRRALPPLPHADRPERRGRALCRAGRTNRAGLGLPLRLGHVALGYVPDARPALRAHRPFARARHGALAHGDGGVRGLLPEVAARDR